MPDIRTSGNPVRKLNQLASMDVDLHQLSSAAAVSALTRINKRGTSTELVFDGLHDDSGLNTELLPLIMARKVPQVHLLAVIGRWVRERERQVGQLEQVQRRMGDR